MRIACLSYKMSTDVSDDNLPLTCPETRTKRKYRASRNRSNSQPSKILKYGEPSTIDVHIEDDDTPKKLDKLINMINNLQKDVTAIKHDVSELTTTVNTIKEEFITKDVAVTEQAALEAVNKEISNINITLNKISENNPMVLTQSIASATCEIKSAVAIPDYEKHIYNRKYSYYKYLHNKGRYDIHQDWLNSEEPFIPPKYMPKELNYQEPAEQYLVRKNRGLNNLKADMDLLLIKSNTGKAELESIDSVIEKSINDTDVTEDVKLNWNNEYNRRVKAEELISNRLWEKMKKGVVSIKERAVDKISNTNENRSYVKALKRNISNNNANHTYQIVENPWVMVNRHNRSKNQQWSYPNVNVPPPPFNMGIQTPFQTRRKYSKWKGKY